MKTWISRRVSSRQRLLPFLERRLKRERSFKALILAATVAAVALVAVGLPRGRGALRSLPGRITEIRWRLGRSIGIEPEPAAVAAYRHAQRAAGVAATTRQVEQVYRDASPALRAFLNAARLTADTGVIRWGNVDLTFLLSGGVFETDDNGRAYRLRPDTRAVWLRQIVLGALDRGQLLVPDTPEVRAAAQAAGLEILEGSEQRSSARGFRGPLPDPGAAVTGIVLGDSFMQGVLLPDDQTPPAYLQRALEARLGKPASVLNTGLLGYSPEQYYYTLVSCLDFVRPDFVVVSVFANDFGDEHEALRGRGAWEEAGYWLQEIQRLCTTRRIVCLLVPLACEPQLTGNRTYRGYPGRVADAALFPTERYLDPLDAFVSEDLRLRQERVIQPLGNNVRPSPLYNGHLVDGHFSARGAELWAALVAERLELLLLRARGK